MRFTSASWRPTRTWRRCITSGGTVPQGPRRKSNRPLAFRALLRRSSQIAAYRRTSARIADRSRLLRRDETPASGHIHRRLVSEMGLIAMQKVVGSNPISRFASNPYKWASRPSRGKSNHRRFRPIPPRFRSAAETGSRLPSVHSYRGRWRTFATSQSETGGRLRRVHPHGR
jgi:hypothetical protein